MSNTSGSGQFQLPLSSLFFLSLFLLLFFYAFNVLIIQTSKHATEQVFPSPPSSVFRPVSSSPAAQLLTGLLVFFSLTVVKSVFNAICLLYETLSFTISVFYKWWHHFLCILYVVTSLPFCFRRSRVYLNQDLVTCFSVLFLKSKSTSRCRVTSLSCPLAVRSTSQGRPRRWGKRGSCCRPSGQWVTCSLHSHRAQRICPSGGGCHKVGVPLVESIVPGLVSLWWWVLQVLYFFLIVTIVGS